MSTIPSSFAKRIAVLLFLLQISFFSRLVAQNFEPFEVCDMPNQNSCTCATAPVVCLDNFSFNMSGFQHNEDIINDFCSGIPTTVHNPTWIAFIANCTEIDVDINFTNCRRRFGSLPGRGIQFAVYENCQDALSGNCITELSVVDICAGSGIHNISSSNLTVGNTYIMVFDGCFGDICDVNLSVNGPCNNCSGIAPFTVSDIFGPLALAPFTPMTYSMIPTSSSDLNSDGIIDGASEYRWTLSDTPGYGQPLGGSFILEQTGSVGDFTLPGLDVGFYELCFDAANLPTIDFSDPPPTACITLGVTDMPAGLVYTSQVDVCPLDTIGIQIIGANNGIRNNTLLVVADIDGTVIQVDNDTIGNFTSSSCLDSFIIYSYNYELNAGVAIPVIGDNMFNFPCEQLPTCDLDSTIIVYSDTLSPILNYKSAINIDLMGQTTIDLSATYIDLGSIDNCSIDSLYLEMSTLDCSNIDFSQPIQNTLYAEDFCGNVVSGYFEMNLFNYNDFSCPADISHVLSSTSSDSIIIYSLPSFDECGAELVWTQVDNTGFSSGSAFPLGATIQSYNVLFESGLIKQCNFEVYLSPPLDSLVRINNTSLYIESPLEGVVLRSQNGNCWKVYINNLGEQSIRLVPCP